MTVYTSPEVGPGLFDGIEPDRVRNLPEVAGSETLGLDQTLDERFWTFHRENPHVFDEFRKIANDLRRVGHQRLGAKMICEAIRFTRAMKTTDPDFKLNNSYISRYARLLIAREPSFEGFFSLRELRS